jgi:hypothetical protein
MDSPASPPSLERLLLYRDGNTEEEEEAEEEATDAESEKQCKHFRVSIARYYIKTFVCTRADGD